MENSPLGDQANVAEKSTQQNSLAKNAELPKVSDYDRVKEDVRKAAAQKAGLPENVTWDEITKVGSEANRKAAAQKAGLPENATWDEINRLRGEDDIRIEEIKGSELAKLSKIANQGPTYPDVPEDFE